MNISRLSSINASSLTGASWLTAQQRFLRWGLLLSVVCHLALLAWQQASPPAFAPKPSELEIVMVNATTESEPSQAVLLAQSNLDGGGQADQGYMTTFIPHTGDATEPIMLETLIRQRQQLEVQQQQLLTQLSARDYTSQGRPASNPAESSEMAGEDETDQDRIVLNGQIAVLTERIKRDNARPRKHFDAAAARKTAYAPYIDQWRQRIEQVGTEHYPTGVDGKSYGSVQATLTIRADGSIADITINRPSDKPLLNQAVRRIAQLSAPFAPFPADMARQIDQLVLTRTWHFVNGALETRQP
ncbi:MAG: energy transducer TonB [Burkholderiaceae bacterium]|nr:energy transducer TonB [Burkholderiaceae bacterium]